MIGADSNYSSPTVHQSSTLAEKFHIVVVTIHHYNAEEIPVAVSLAPESAKTLLPMPHACRPTKLQLFALIAETAFAAVE